MLKSYVKKGILVVMGLAAILGLLGCGTGGSRNIVKHVFSGLNQTDGGSAEYKKVVSFEYGESGYTPGFTYSFKDGELTYNGPETYYEDMTVKLDDETVVAVSELFARLNVMSWNKFDKNKKHVLDGTGFSLSAKFEDGKTISAEGSNAFPKNYSEFSGGIVEILSPAVNAGLDEIRENKFREGKYDGPLDFAMITYKDRGASGNDSYNFIIRSGEDNTFDIEIEVVSESGDFGEAGTYNYRGECDKCEEILARIQEVLLRYEVYKWDGYDESTDDFNDREWFQLCFNYPEALINCCGCGDTEHYEEVRAELLTILMEYAAEICE